ncbi:hypothetical protein A0J61_10706 [Choanephora cucurbitarum]|uniref:Uncharacterized protein n=1 Tax=Choanephora cucurbitarum TaxID=101091 RepID=A0A1C7MXX1_9FUNG|nr:hypothetical protein A0J61_10706 [Choanephora cucurbitarum]
MVIEFLNDHLSKNCCKLACIYERRHINYKAQEQQQQHKLDSLETAIKKFCTNEVSPFAGEGLSDQIQVDKILLRHKLCRTEEELEYLNEEDERFVRKLSKKLNSVESAVAKAKPEHLALLQREQLRLLAVRQQAETHLPTPMMLCIANKAFTGGGTNNLEEEKVVDDEEENSNEEKLALFVEAIGP